MDRSFCPWGREHAKRRGAVHARHYGVEPLIADSEIAPLSAAGAMVQAAFVLLQRETDRGDRLAGLRNSDDGLGTGWDFEAARGFQLAITGLELDILLLAASQQSNLGGHPRHGNWLSMVAHIKLQLVGTGNEFVFDVLGFGDSTTVHRLYVVAVVVSSKGCARERNGVR